MSVELFRVVGLRLFGLCLFGSWLFELCVFVSSELFGLRVFKLCVGLGCASCFVRAWFSHFCFAFVGFVADLGAGVGGLTRCALCLVWAPT